MGTRVARPLTRPDLAVPRAALSKSSTRCRMLQRARQVLCSPTGGFYRIGLVLTRSLPCCLQLILCGQAPDTALAAALASVQFYISQQLLQVRALSRASKDVRSGYAFATSCTRFRWHMHHKGLSHLCVDRRNSGKATCIRKSARLTRPAARSW